MPCSYPFIKVILKTVVIYTFPQETYVEDLVLDVCGLDGVRVELCFALLPLQGDRDGAHARQTEDLTLDGPARGDG